MAKPTDADSITRLLKDHDAELSAVKANKLLLQLGVLEELERDSANKVDADGKPQRKKYKVISEAGQAFGYNLENPMSPDQTSPVYYREAFPELLKKMLEQLDA